MTATSTGSIAEVAIRTWVPTPPLPGTVTALACWTCGKLSIVASEKQLCPIGLPHLTMPPEYGPVGLAYHATILARGLEAMTFPDASIRAQ